MTLCRCCSFAKPKTLPEPLSQFGMQEKKWAKRYKYQVGHEEPQRSHARLVVVGGTKVESSIIGDSLLRLAFCCSKRYRPVKLT